MSEDINLLGVIKSFSNFTSCTFKLIVADDAFIYKELIGSLKSQFGINKVGVAGASFALGQSDLVPQLWP